MAEWIADHEDRNGAVFGLTTEVSDEIRKLMQQLQPSNG
jgi:hypothetical protein